MIEADCAEDEEALIAEGVAYIAFALANAALFGLMFSTAQAARSEALARASQAAYAVMADRVASLVEPQLAFDHALQMLGNSTRHRRARAHRAVR